MKNQFSLVLLLCIHCFSQAQYAFTNEDIKITEAIESENENTDLMDQLMDVFAKSYNINYLSEIELSQIPELTPKQCNAIIQHRKYYGHFHNIYELQQIESFDQFDLLNLQNKLTFRRPIRQQFKQILKEKDYSSKIIFQNAMKLHLSKGFILEEHDSMAFLGGPVKTSFRIQTKLSNVLEMGLQIGKDAGERIQNGFYSGFVSYNGKGILKQLIIGNYQLNLGQGLSFGSGMSIGKSSLVMNIMKASNRIRPYRSLSETGYFKGFVSLFQVHKNIKILSFASSVNKKVLLQTNEDGNASIQSVKTNGLNRNFNEMKYTDLIHQKLFGLNLEININKFGLSFHSVNVFNEANKIETKVYQNQIKYSSVWLKGLELKYQFENVLLFSEIGVQKNQKAYIIGSLISLDKNLDLSIIHRNYQKQYNTEFTNSFSESGTQNGEKAWYIGLTWSPKKYLQVNTYCDLYQNQWLKYRVDAPSKGFEKLIEISHKKRNGTIIYFRWKQSNFMRNESGTQVLNRIDQINNTRYRVHLEYPLSPTIIGKTRIEFVTFKTMYGTLSRGSMMYKEFKYKYKSYLQLHVRWMLFNVDDYDSRIYAFENDLSQSFSILAFQNKGHSSYILLNLKMIKNLQIKVRFAAIRYFNIDSIGSGLDEIASDKQKEIKLELSYQL